MPRFSTRHQKKRIVFRVLKMGLSLFDDPTNRQHQRTTKKEKKSISRKQKKELLSFFLRFV